MIDLETLDTRPTAVFQQVGWCLFELESDKIFGQGLIYVDVQSALDIGLTMDWETIKFWLNQREKPRLNLLEPGITIHHALFALRGILEPPDWLALDGVWSHGASFDIPILHNAWDKALKNRPPWSHKQVRDTRTLFMLSPATEWHGEEDEKHFADKDAVMQAKQLQGSFKRLCSAFSPGFQLPAFH